MNRSQAVFKLIDVSMNMPQNGMVKYSGIRHYENIPYSDISIDTMGDIYVRDDLAEKGEKLPVVLNIHGGGFVMGDKKYRYGISSWWADKGYIVYNISYRLSPDVYFPENLVDLVDALNFLKVLAEDYPMDLSKIVITGDSSGGYSAAYLTALCFNDGLRKEICEKSGIEIAKCELKPALCAPCCGIYDIETLLKTKMPFKLIPITAKTYTGFELKDDMSNITDYPLYEYLSPINFVTKDWCKVFLIWTWADMICVDQGRPMYNAVCKKIGKKNIGYYAADGIMNNHCFHLNQSTKESKKALAALEEFASEALDYKPNI